MLGSEFVRTYANKGLPAWEAAALALAREGHLTPWPWATLVLADGEGNICQLPVQTDVLAIGLLEDHVRLPLLPSTAQSILNLHGWLLPTPWLVYRIWQESALKLEPVALAPNRGASLEQYAAHSSIIDGQIADALAALPPVDPSSISVAGIKKHIVVSDDMQTSKVSIFGWYRPSPPFADVFDDGRPMRTPGRQPIQPFSNAHVASYVDYSHGVQAVGAECLVNGTPMETAALYTHPTLSRLVNRGGPVRTPRYPASVPPAKNRPAHVASWPASVVVVSETPGDADYALGRIAKR